MSPDTSIVERMYRTLVDEIRENRPELLSDTFTVAEIYQNLVPYRTHRDRIGAEMNGDYEHALLRLLAGEGDYLTLQSEAARRRLREELESIHPDTGLYRDFAACEVRLDEESLPEDTTAPAPSGDDGQGDGAASPGPEAQEAPEPFGDGPGAFSEAAGQVAGDEETVEEGDEGAAEASEEPLVMSFPGDAEAEEAEAPAGPDAPVQTDAPDAGEQPPPDEEDAQCRWCRESLPARDDLRFCPYCGSRVDLRPCPECGTELEEEWLFCVACGHEAGG